MAHYNTQVPAASMLLPPVISQTTEYGFSPNDLLPTPDCPQETHGEARIAAIGSTLGSRSLHLRRIPMA